MPTGMIPDSVAPLVPLFAPYCGGLGRQLPLEGALAILLAGEVVASMAVVSESVLVYIAKKRNLAISLAVITLQAGLTVGFILLLQRFGYNEGFQAAGAAGALLVALAGAVTFVFLTAQLGYAPTPAAFTAIGLAFAAIAAKRGLTSVDYPDKSFYFLGGLTEATETLAFFAAMCLWPEHFDILAYVFSALCAVTIATRLWWGWRAFA